jgi:hypothetical protein
MLTALCHAGSHVHSHTDMLALAISTVFAIGMYLATVRREAAADRKEVR